MQAQIQALTKLAQSNIDLLTRFSTSPEVSAQASANASLVFQQAAESAMRLMQSGAFAHMVQGILKNYTEFLTDFSNGGMVMLSEGQAAMTRQMHAANSGLVEATDARRRRARTTS